MFREVGIKPEPIRIDCNQHHRDEERTGEQSNLPPCEQRLGESAFQQPVACLADDNRASNQDDEWPTCMQIGPCKGDDGERQEPSG